MALPPDWAPMPTGTSASTDCWPGAVMSLQAVKAVEIGRGVTAAESFGSTVHDPIHYAAEDTGKPTRFTRPQNNAGGIEGGVSNGEDIVVRGYLKPISTLRRPLESVRFDTREANQRKLRTERHLRGAGGGSGGRGHGRADRRAAGPARSSAATRCLK